MKTLIPLLAALSLASSPAPAQSLWGQIQQSHIDGNVPSAEEFKPLLERDLLAYFQRIGRNDSSSVTYEFLRDEPTQSGVGSPKFYLWVRVLAGSAMIDEGAVSVAAVERIKFEILNFISRTDIQGTPSQIAEIFPAIWWRQFFYAPRLGDAELLPQMAQKIGIHALPKYDALNVSGRTNNEGSRRNS